MSALLFKCRFEISRHSSKKNEKTVRRNRKTSRFFIGASDKASYVAKEMTSRLTLEKLKQRIDEPITKDLNAKFTFFFPKTVYFTKKGARNQKLPDLSNLYELPQDVLQNVGIILNDTNICSHDGSRRAPTDDPKYFIEIELTEFEK